MGFLHPEWLLLAIPAGFLWFWLRGASASTFRGGSTATNLLRAVVAILVIAAIAGPYLRTAATGRDLIIAVDRSRSMPAEAPQRALETIRLAEGERPSGDRIGVLGFGADVKIERLPDREKGFAGFESAVAADGSDLAGAIDTALKLIPDDRPGSILLISDGEANGGDAIAAARRAYARGVSIFVRSLRRPDAPDLSIERLDLPDIIGAGEPFQFTVWVWSDIKTTAEFSLDRKGTILSSGKRVFEAGLNRIVFRDLLDLGGVVPYKVSVTKEGDPTPENNRAIGALRAEGPRAVLVVNHDGAADSLVTALRKAKIPVEVARAEAARLDPVSLASHRSVILENVAVSRLRDGVGALRDFVTERGGGLLVTGGRASFGLGGYHKSDLDEILPVSMELRKEHRKMGMALAISLDRSGSMMAPVGNNLVKMDLANLGTCAAVELLSPMDSVAVIAVDSAPHVVQALTPADDIPSITSKVRTIKSMGGGIFCYQALVAAGKALDNATQLTRHIILFADAADAEEPGRYKELLAEFETQGISVSVIGLGTDKDSDAEFLKDIAKRGKGEIYFTNKPDDLPRLFAQDTLTVARSSFVEGTTPVASLSGLLTLGEVPPGPFPAPGGYNLTYLRPGASAGVLTTDEYKAPIVAMKYDGLGRTAAYTGQVGGTYGAGLVAWNGFSQFFVTFARWLSGQEEPQEYFVAARREGKDAVVSVEIDPAAGAPPDTSQLTARILEPNGNNRELVLRRVDENKFEGRYALGMEGISIGTVHLADGKFVTLPPMALPYSPEFERPVEPGAGEKLLRRIAAESGGKFEAEVTDLFEGERSGRAWKLLTREFAVAALVLLLSEIVARRLMLFAAFRVPARVRELAKRAAAIPTIARPRPAGARPAAEATVPAAPGAPRAAAGPRRPAPSAEPAPGGSLSEALSRARKSAEKETGRS
jgi:uncharacterized membrane protein